MDFFQKYFDWLGHIIEAVCIAGAVAGILWALTLAVMIVAPMAGIAAAGLSWPFYALLGGAFATGHFHGREKRDCEVRVKMRPPHLKAYWFGMWSWDELTDFFPVWLMFSVAFIAAIVMAI